MLGETTMERYSMDQATYDRFKELRQDYYLAGRCLLINRVFGMAGINFGYCIELSLKFILAYNGHPKKELMKHNIEEYYKQVIDKKYIPPLRVSDDFLSLMNERLNTRYPSMIGEQMAKHELESRAYVFPIDMLHCYDDFILQLDDAISNAVGDHRISIGFRSCRDLKSINGRIFFHCNDHAFERISIYKENLVKNRDPGDDFEDIDSILENPIDLWNFKGLIAYRPWGPKTGWSPANTFSFPIYEDKKLFFKAAQWEVNNVGVDMYLSSSNIILPKGTYRVKISTIQIPKKE
jgi:hypothetical protein